MATAPASLPSIEASSCPKAYIGDSDSVDRNGHYHARKAECEKKLKKLISYLDKWLQSGFEGTRASAVTKFEAEVSRFVHPRKIRLKSPQVPEIGWTNLYSRKALTIRTRLLAMGWLEVVLDEADIIGKSDRVRGPR